MASAPIAVHEDGSQTPVGPSRSRKKTILGVDLRRLIVGTIRSLARGKDIRVAFRGSRAYTNGKTVILPKIRDLAEIAYDKARALIGYAIHELGHILFTDWTQVERALAEGKLVKKFENCIEDYRIERELVTEFPGAKEDLTALRVRIHPRLSDLTVGWLRDPRACGPLALTWTGSQLNGFPNPHLQQTLDAISPPVLAIIQNWTDRMEGVASTAEAVDLAIAFKAEADAYAAMTQLPDMAKPKQPPHAANDDEDVNPPRQEQDPDQGGQAPEDAPNRHDDPDGHPQGRAPADEGQEESGDGSAPKAQDDAIDMPGMDGPSGETSDAGDDDASAGGSPTDGSTGQGNTAGEPDGAPTSDASSGQPVPDADGSPQDGVDGLDFDPSAASKPGEGGRSTPSESGSIEMNGGLLDEQNAHGDATGECGSGEPEMGSSISDEEADPAQRDDDGADRQQDAPMQGPAVDDSDDDRGFGDSLDESAEFEDMLDDMREQIAEDVRNGGALPEEAPEASDGEVDPSDLEGDLDEANATAPDYTSDAGTKGGKANAPGASKHHYDDTRFRPVSKETDECQYSALRSAAAGVISNTARTIKRLLMAEAKEGVITNRRSGQFDIRNMSAIVRNTGTCYKRSWTRPAPTTLLAILADFSGSMDSRGLTWLMGANSREDEKEDEHSPLTLAMMGALAIEQATQGTQVASALYAYTGHSPHVTLSVFKEGMQSRIETRRRIGAYRSIGMDCTPTAEAMAAVASRLENATEDRKVLLVLTDGQADNMDLCRDVSEFYIRRGIEVVAIGIQNSSVERWAPVSHVINDIKELPKALLSTIDPRARRNRRKAA